MRWVWKFVIYLSTLKNNIFIYNKFYMFRHKKYGKARSRAMLTGTGLAVQFLPRLRQNYPQQEPERFDGE